MLNEVVESARALTGARYGAIATIDEAGVPQDFVTSGFTADEHRKLVEWPDGPRLFEYFRDLPGPLRLADVPEYVRSLGFSPDRLPSRAFQGTPMRHRGVHVGNFYLVEKEGGEAFTDEDEEVLVLFASQAATAIANARTYRAEQRARAGLEALIETSPVGVVVFEARTGDLVSLNREARRIVEGGCATGSATTPPARPGYSTSGVSATAWPGPARRASPDRRPPRPPRPNRRTNWAADPAGAAACRVFRGRGRRCTQSAWLRSRHEKSTTARL